MAGLVKTFVNMLRLRSGFKMKEVMKGAHRFVGGPYDGQEHPMEFRGTWGSDNIFDFVKCLLTAKPAVAWLIGEVTIGGLCARVPMEGSLALNYLGEGTIRYTFKFSHNMRRYLYVGEKREIKPWNLHKSHTTCYGQAWDITDNIARFSPVSESITYFEFLRLPSFLASFRLT